jgi:hypothetical protein
MSFDHTHCHFALISASPEIEILGKIQDPAVYGNFPEFKKLLNRKFVRDAALKLLEFTAQEMNQIVGTIPDEWVTDAATRTRISEFAMERATFVGNTIERILFPQAEFDL